MLLALFMTAPASGETVEPVSAALSGEGSGGSDQPETSAATVLPDTPEASAPAPETTATPGAEVTTSAATSAVHAIEDVSADAAAAVPTPGNEPSSPASVPVATAPVNQVLHRPRETVAAAATQVEQASASAAVKPEGAPVRAFRNQLAEGVESVGRNTLESVSLVDDRLAAVLSDPALELDGLLGATVPTAAGETPASGFPAAGEGPLAGETAAIPRLRSARSFALWGGLASTPYTGVHTLGTKDFGVVETRAAKPTGATAPSPTDLLRAAFAGGAHGDLGSPVPLKLPVPVPGSPTHAVPDAGGPSFVPIAALLALLALVAPATLRRLGRGADFHPPIPFICALERPG